MNVSLAPLSPLPRVLAEPGLNGSGRRHRIGYHEIDTVALRHFNELLQYLDLRVVPLDRDRLASAARELVDQPHAGRAPACIQQRMRRAAAIDLMVGDPDWETLPATEVAASLLVDYMRHSDRRRTLIPNALPVVGRLDDAIVVETIWPSVGPEVRKYLDFCHVRHVEANLGAATTPGLRLHPPELAGRGARRTRMDGPLRTRERPQLRRGRSGLAVPDQLNATLSAHGAGTRSRAQCGSASSAAPLPGSGPRRGRVDRALRTRWPRQLYPGLGLCRRALPHRLTVPGLENACSLRPAAPLVAGRPPAGRCVKACSPRPGC